MMVHFPVVLISLSLVFSLLKTCHFKNYLWQNKVVGNNSSQMFQGTYFKLLLITVCNLMITNDWYTILLLENRKTGSYKCAWIWHIFIILVFVIWMLTLIFPQYLQYLKVCWKFFEYNEIKTILFSPLFYSIIKKTQEIK